MTAHQPELTITSHCILGTDTIATLVTKLEATNYARLLTASLISSRCSSVN